MKAREGLGLALLQIRTQKLKSFFSVVGVIIGVMFLITVVSIVEGMNRYIEDDFATAIFGINTITVSRTPEVQVNPDEETQRAYRRRPRLRFGDADAIERGLSVPGVVSVVSTSGGSLVA
ncbi:MAG: ABC transporter permease, partial [Gemmatimonadota bacterium]